MHTQSVAEKARRLPLHERLLKNADGIIENIARDYGVSTLDVVRAMPDEHRSLVPSALFELVFEDLRTWGEVLFIVHTADIVLECAGTIPPGTFGRGYYNLHGDSPIGGHIKADHCSAIAFVSRPFMGRASCSIQFFNQHGEAMFKVFVRRDEARALITAQVEKFEALKARLSSAA
jgi:heme iron utilization protein